MAKTGTVIHVPEEILGPDHLADLVRDTHPASCKWYDIGLQLGLTMYILDYIKTEFQNQPGDCFRETLKEWLKSGEGRMERLVGALSSPTVKHGKLSRDIEKKYLTPSSEHVDTLSLRSTGSSIGKLTGSISSLNSDVTPYGCGCGNCTFAMYVDGGCPQPTPSTSSFPFLSTDELQDHERQILHGRLYEEFEKISYKFSSFTRSICESLIDREVPLKKLERSLRDLKAFQPSYSDTPLLQDRFTEIKNAQDIDDVFDILTDYTSFFNCSIIEHIVKEHGTKQDKAALEAYHSDLMEYCKRNIFECPAYSPLKRGLATLVLKVEDEVVENGNMKHLNSLTSKVSRALSLSKFTLNLCNVEKGCVQLVYQIPNTVVKHLFPLHKRQGVELRHMGVTRLVCRKHNYFFVIKKRTSKIIAVKPPKIVLTQNQISETTTAGVSNDHQTVSSPTQRLAPVGRLGLMESITPEPEDIPADSNPVSVRSDSVDTAELNELHDQLMPLLSDNPSCPLIPEEVILEKHPWYHSMISRREAEIRLLKTRTGSFLIRRKDEPGVYVLSEIYLGEAKHYIIKKNNGMYQSVYELEQRSFPTIPEMVTYLQGKFFFQPCPRSGPLGGLMSLPESDWLSPATQQQNQQQHAPPRDTEVGDSTGDSAYGTGAYTGYGVPTVLPGVNMPLQDGPVVAAAASPSHHQGASQDKVKKGDYTRLQSENMDYEKPYQQVQKGDLYKDYKDISSIEWERELALKAAAPKSLDHVTESSDHVTEGLDHVSESSDHVTEDSDHVTDLDSARTNM